MSWKKNGQDANPFLSSLRVIPWWTDHCVNFISGVLKWLPNYYRRPIRVLELGSGNSTLFFLSKGCHVISYESDSNWAHKINMVHKTWFSSVNTVSTNEQDPLLSVVQYVPTDFPDCFRQNIAASDIIVIDADPREQGLQIAIDNLGSHHLLVIDNWNFQCYSDSLKAKITNDRNLSIVNFQQCQGRFNHCVADKFGWEAPHEWVSSVVYRNDSLYKNSNITTSGFPQMSLVNHPSFLDNTFNLFDQKYL